MKQALSNHGIGASEISAIAGLNPFASPWDIWRRKVGETPDIEQNEPMEWGNRLEPAIRQKFCDETGWTVEVPKSSLFHPEFSWARATPDGITFDAAVRIGLVQIKNVGHWSGREWESSVPSYVQIQTQWEMAVTGDQRDDVAALIGGNEFRRFTVHRDSKMIADLFTIATEFWKRVQDRTPPPVDESDACTDHFRKRLAKGDAIELVADTKLDEIMSEWCELHRRAKQDEKRTKQLRNTILAEMANAGASRVKSQWGTATLRNVGGGDKSETDWRLVAQLLGSKIPDDYAALVAANTNAVTSTAKQTLYAPREWGKETA